MFFSDHFKRYALYIIIFLTALFFIITISNPATFFNDEWITLNQLRQMDQGHQMIYNEGTYGVFKNGTITPYFDAKDRYLGYTLMLPILSYPFLQFFSLFGDNFRLFALFFWAFLPVLIILLINQYLPAYSRIWGLPWVWIVFTLMIGLFFFNLIFYYPFPFVGDTVPREIAAVVFTQHILFSILCVVSFSIIYLYAKNFWYSLFGLILCIGCSSYIFWATNAKDHLLTVTILAISLFFLLRYLLQGNHLDGISGFISIGLLSWARPEFALMMFIFTSAFFIFLNLFIRGKKLKSPFSFHIRNLLLPLATAFGALPFLLNNYYVNKNPFIPTFLFYLTKNDANSLMQNISSLSPESKEGMLKDLPGISIPLFNKIISHFSIKSTNFFYDFYSVLFDPHNGSMSIFAIVPLSLIIVIIMVYFFYFQKNYIKPDHLLAIIYLCILCIGLPITYIGGIHGLNTSIGITPDIRYLSPIYLVITLLGIFLVYQIFSDINWRKVTGMITGILVISIPFNLYMLLFIFTGGGSAPQYIDFYNVFSIGLAIITATIFALSIRNPYFREYFVLFLGAMIISPLSWQILMTYFFASAKFNGYPFWIPIMELIYNRIVIVN